MSDGWHMEDLATTNPLRTSQGNFLIFYDVRAFSNIYFIGTIAHARIFSLDY